MEHPTHNNRKRYHLLVMRQTAHLGNMNKLKLRKLLIILIIFLISVSEILASESPIKDKPEQSINYLKEIIKESKDGKSGLLKSDIWKYFNENNTANDEEHKLIDAWLKDFLIEKFERVLSIKLEKISIGKSDKYDSKHYAVYGYGLKIPWSDEDEVNISEHSSIIVRFHHWLVLVDNPINKLGPSCMFTDSSIDFYSLFNNESPVTKFEFAKMALDYNSTDFYNAYNIRKKMIALALMFVKEDYARMTRGTLHPNSIYYFDEPNVKGFQIGSVENNNPVSLSLFLNDDEELNISIFKVDGEIITQSHIDFIINNIQKLKCPE